MGRTWGRTGSRNGRRCRAAGTAAKGRTPSLLAAQRVEAAVAGKFDKSAYALIRDLPTLQAWIAEATEAGVVAIDTQTTSQDPMQAELCGVALALQPGRAAYVPLIHKSGEGDLLGGGLVEGQIPSATLLRC